jgi:transposase InsO family protein
MTDLYMLVGISKQSHLQAIAREKEIYLRTSIYINTILEAREVHPTMGLRNIYETYQPDDIGRDAFIELGKRAGYQLEIKASPVRTTFSIKSSRYSNLLLGIKFTDVNQVWSSDITYFRIGETVYYIVFILDVYSRRIVGYNVANHMRSESTILALQMALTLRGVENYGQKLIHHSDRGTQYASNVYTETLTAKGIRISMCQEVYENTHIERINGTIKNGYLIHYGIKNYKELVLGLAKAVDIYNNQKPHSSLPNRMSPCQFEAMLLSGELKKRPEMEIYVNKDNPINKQNVLNQNQLSLSFEL